jgi:hypothetical protein
MNRIVHFEIHADDPRRSAKFYGDVFGWKFEEWSGGEYWLISTGEQGTPGIDGGMMKRMTPPPVDGQAVNAFVNVVEVADIESTSAAIVKAGGTIAVPKQEIQGMGYSAYFKDPESNLFGIYQGK